MQEYFRVSPPSVHQMLLTLARTSGSNLLSRTRSIAWGKHGASLAQWVTAGCQSMDVSRGRKKPGITRKASPVQYPIATSLLPMSLRLGG
jgi:hypothetical protein